MHKDCKEILFSLEDIVTRCEELGQQINHDYEGKRPLFIGLLNGSVPFLAELCKHIDLDMEYTFMQVSSYKGTQSSDLNITKDLGVDVSQRDLLIIEDIIDTGKTLKTVKELLLARAARSVKIVTLLDKKEARTHSIEADYVGFDIANQFVIGFGLDFDQKYRQLPYVGILKEECYK